MENADDMYDNYDADPREGEPEKDNTEDVGEPFLAPKSSFKGDLSPGTVHRVRIEASHDEELELVCLGEETETAPEPAQEPADEMYE
jgi:hypothetical protein